MKKISKENLEAFNGGNCFVAGAVFVAFWPVTQMAHLISGEDSRFGKCWG